MSRNKSFDVRARFGAIYSASKTKKYLLKNSTIGNRLLFSELANIEFTCPENSNWWLLLPDSNLFLKFQNNFTAEFWATFSYGLLPRGFFWNFSGIFIISIKADTRNFGKKYQQNFLLTRFSLSSRFLSSANFSRNIFHHWNQNISYYCRMISFVLCKRKSYDAKFVTAKCSSTNDGATLSAAKAENRK